MFKIEKGMVYTWITTLSGVLWLLNAQAQVDADATDKTKALYNNLMLMQGSKHILFGQEFFNSFRYSSGSPHGEKDYSDAKEVTGSHPAVLGSDFHYYLEKSATERSYHTEAVKHAYQLGYVVTFDWHLSARGTTSYENTGSPPNLVNNIVADLNEDRAWFYGELDKVISIINNDLKVGNDTIPIVFRPFHEMNGNWFWWGSAATSVDNYKSLYVLTVNYVKERTKSVLFCWSPNIPLDFNYYPGDEYVDVVGLDYYEANSSTLQTQLGMLVDFAATHGKVAVLSETGNRVNGDNASLYWNNTILPALINDPANKAWKIAWLLTWINASWSFPYVPHAASSQTAKSSFISFRQSSNIIFGDDLPDMYSNDPITAVAFSMEAPWVDVYPVPASTELTIELEGFGTSVYVIFYDVAGRTIHSYGPTQDEVIRQSLTSFNPGVYILQVSDGVNATRRKFIVK
jgi:mannan endo-1,4-beta-mannosidase